MEGAAFENSRPPGKLDPLSAKETVKREDKPAPLLYICGMSHPKAAEFDKRLKKLFDEVDGYIEDVYGKKYPLHPVRPDRGETANPEADGLFNIGADFTPGFGSELGRGYIITLKTATLENVDVSAREEIYTNAAEKAGELLPLYFPERKLAIRRDGNNFKIQGDFSLGNI